jgi:hypothetical protein
MSNRSLLVIALLVSVFVDPKSDVANDEFYFEVSDFKVLK